MKNLFNTHTNKQDDINYVKLLGFIELQENMHVEMGKFCNENRHQLNQIKTQLHETINEFFEEFETKVEKLENDQYKSIAQKFKTFNLKQLQKDHNNHLKNWDRNFLAIESGMEDLKDDWIKIMKNDKMYSDVKYYINDHIALDYDSTIHKLFDYTKKQDKESQISDTEQKNLIQNYTEQKEVDKQIIQLQYEEIEKLQQELKDSKQFKQNQKPCQKIFEVTKNQEENCDKCGIIKHQETKIYCLGCDQQELQVQSLISQAMDQQDISIEKQLQHKKNLLSSYMNQSQQQSQLPKDKQHNGAQQFVLEKQNFIQNQKKVIEQIQQIDEFIKLKQKILNQPKSSPIQDKKVQSQIEKLGFQQFSQKSQQHIDTKKIESQLIQDQKDKHIPSMNNIQNQLKEEIKDKVGHMIGSNEKISELIHTDHAQSNEKQNHQIQKSHKDENHKDINQLNSVIENRSKHISQKQSPRQHSQNENLPKDQFILQKPESLKLNQNKDENQKFPIKAQDKNNQIQNEEEKHKNMENQLENFMNQNAIQDMYMTDEQIEEFIKKMEQEQK